jgi:hypothetical protein
MGWCGGTEIFDSTIDAFHEHKIPYSIDFIKNFIDILEAHDWDNLCESNHFEVNPLVRKAVKQMKPHYFEDEDE